MSDHEDWLAERKLADAVLWFCTYTVFMGVTLTMAIQQSKPELYTAAYLCAGFMVWMLADAGQYRYSQTRNTVVER